MPIEYHKINSQSLANNKLGDSSTRDIIVYRPPNYSSDKKLPFIVYLSGFLSSGLAIANWQCFKTNLPMLLDHLIINSQIIPMVIAFPDCSSSMGGTQYINNEFIGNFEDFIIKDLIPDIEGKYNCGGTQDFRACMGHSSGGFGSLFLASKYPNIWSVIVSHSGDMGFEYLYKPTIYESLRVLERYNSSISLFLEGFFEAEEKDYDSMSCLMILAMATSYDYTSLLPYGIRLPVDLFTGKIIENYWKNWLKHDPIYMSDFNLENLRKLKGLYFDCGKYDQYNLVYGARLFRKKLIHHNIQHVYDEFSGNHSKKTSQFEKSLKYISKVFT